MSMLGDYTNGILQIIPGANINITGTNAIATISTDLVQTGISSVIAGNGITLTGTAQDVFINNNGITDLSGILPVKVIGSLQHPTITLDKFDIVEGLIAGNGINVTGSSPTYTIDNTGVLSVQAGSNIDITYNNMGSSYPIISVSNTVSNFNYRFSTLPYLGFPGFTTGNTYPYVNSSGTANYFFTNKLFLFNDPAFSGLLSNNYWLPFTLDIFGLVRINDSCTFMTTDSYMYVFLNLIVHDVTIDANIANVDSVCTKGYIIKDPSTGWWYLQFQARLFNGSLLQNFQIAGHVLSFAIQFEVAQIYNRPIATTISFLSDPTIFRGNVNWEITT